MEKERNIVLGRVCFDWLEKNVDKMSRMKQIFFHEIIHQNCIFKYVIRLLDRCIKNFDKKKKNDQISRYMFSRFITKKNIFIPKFEYISGIYFYVHINKIYRFEKRNSKFNIVSSETSSIAAPIRRRVILLYSYLQRLNTLQNVSLYFVILLKRHNANYINSNLTDRIRGEIKIQEDKYKLFTNLFRLMVLNWCIERIFINIYIYH